MISIENTKLNKINYQAIAWQKLKINRICKMDITFLPEKLMITHELNSWNSE